MVFSPSNLLKEFSIGNDAGWFLTFHREGNNGTVEEESVLSIGSIGENQYYAKIQATLPGGLEGGSYSFTIEGLIDDHYRAIAQTANADPPSPKFVKLYLFWQDTNSDVANYLVNLAGLTSLIGGKLENPPESALVAILSITNISRKAGTRRYETTITAKERVFYQLSRRVPTSLCLDTPLILLNEVQERTGVEIETNDEDFTAEGLLIPREGVTLDNSIYYFEEGNTYKQELIELAQAIEQTRNRYGRGMLLIRNGVLYFGSRSIPLEGEDPKPLMLANGLIEVESAGVMDIDPALNEEASSEGQPQRKQFRLILKGRPDLKPGDLVRFDLPPEDVANTTPGIGVALAGSLAGNIIPDLGEDFEHPALLYVTSVKHQLGRTSGFVTTVSGVQLDNLDEPWDERSPSGSRRQPSQHSEPTADGSARAAQSVQRLVQSAMERKRLTEIGEVRQMQTTGQGSQEEAPGQTLTIWQGLEEGDGHRNQAGRLPIQRENPTILERVAYGTPFAWGKCGLVLPRYPGTRVVLTYRNGQSNDPVEMSSLWEAGRGPDSQAGDWWLILPVGIPEADRGAIADEATPEEHTGQVSQDLIDAEGNRVIEVGELTIRIGRDVLKNAGERPERGEEDTVTIEHADAGSKIVMKPDGTVEITATNINLNAEDGDITLNANNVNINADDVAVSVSNAMNVS